MGFKAREVRQRFKYDLRGCYMGLFIEPINRAWRFTPAAALCETRNVAAALMCDMNERLIFIKVVEDEKGEAGYYEDILEQDDANDEAKIKAQMDDPHTIAVIAEVLYYDYSVDDNGILECKTGVWTYDSQCFWLLATTEEMEKLGDKDVLEADVFVHRDELNECADCKYCQHDGRTFRCTKLMEKDIGRNVCDRHNCFLFMKKH